MSTIIPVILCGGSGTRLWPLSRSDRPKQFISLLGNHTLLEETLLRSRTISGATDPICVTADAYGAEVRQSLDGLGLKGKLLLEPEPRGTAPALAAAALVATRLDPGAIIVAQPADHFIAEGEAYGASIARACAAAEQGWLAVLGIVPRRPSSALGYIVPADAIEGLPQVHRLRRFTEKPDAGVAEGLVDCGALWNAGIVVARAAAVIAALRLHEPAVLEAVEHSLAGKQIEAKVLRLDQTYFATAPNISFDKAVLERHNAVAVTALDAMWRDVGTWEEVAELYPADAGGNRYRGKAHLTSSRNSFVFSQHRLTVGIGLTDVVVVDTPDALLVASRDELGRLREVVRALAVADDAGPSAGDLQSGAWSAPERVGDHPVFQTKQISLGAGEVLNYPPHNDASRHGIVVEGSVQVTIGGEVYTCEANQSFRVLPGFAYRLVNRMAAPTTLIEVDVRYKTA